MRRALPVGASLALLAALWGAARATPQEPSLDPSWRGPAALAILVTDEQGRGIDRVEVTLSREGAAGRVRGLFTDAEGRLELEGLAEGEWQVDLEREGFMLYTAYLKLERDRSPEVAFASRQRAGTYWAELNAAFLEPGIRVDDPELRTGRATVAEARREERRREREERRAEERREQRSRRGDFARVVDTPVFPEAAEPAEDPAAEPALAEPAEGDASALAGAASGAAIAPPGACIECAPGQWSLRVEAITEPPRERCAGDPSAELDSVAAILAGELGGPLAQFAGALRAERGGAFELFGGGGRERLEESLGRWRGDRRCVVVAAVLPAGARYVGFRFQAATETTLGECPASGPCQLPGAAWGGPPRVTAAGAVTLVSALYSVEGAEAPARALFTVYFEPATGWRPPTR